MLASSCLLRFQFRLIWAILSLWRTLGTFFLLNYSLQWYLGGSERSMMVWDFAGILDFVLCIAKVLNSNRFDNKDTPGPGWSWIYLPSLRIGLQTSISMVKYGKLNETFIQLNICHAGSEKASLRNLWKLCMRNLRRSIGLKLGNWYLIFQLLTLLIRA